MPHGAIVVLGNPGNRRVRLFQEALARRGRPPARVVAWKEHLEDGAPLPLSGPSGAGPLDVAPDDVLRIDSPGEDADVDQALVTLGGGPTLDPEPGRIQHRAAWYRGFATALRRLGDVPAMNAPDDILACFDKAVTHARLAAAGVPVPRSPGAPASWGDVRRMLKDVPRLFVKPRHGSSASGVLAIEAFGGRLQAWTSVRREDGRLFNRLGVRRETDERELAAIVDALAPDGLHAEAWVPKASVAGGSFDLRVLAVAGRARHVVVRVSASPLTNLHLGNRRGDPAVIAGRRGEIDELVGAVAACFPRSLYLGVDVLVPVRGRMVVGEVNAFGDLLPGALDEGEDPWEAEIAALEARTGGGAASEAAGCHVTAAVP